MAVLIIPINKDPESASLKSLVKEFEQVKIHSSEMSSDDGRHHHLNKWPFTALATNIRIRHNEKVASCLIVKLEANDLALCNH